METRATKQVCFHYLYILSFSLVNSVFLPHPCLLTVKNRTDKSALNEKGGGAVVTMTLTMTRAKAVLVIPREEEMVKTRAVVLNVMVVLQLHFHPHYHSHIC